MNANELADELDDYYIAITDEYTGFGYLKEAAAMLRQQQAEIEALKILVDELAGYKASYENGIRMEDGYGLN